MIATSLRQQAAFIEKRKQELGYEGTDYVAVNPGRSHTPSKRALLSVLKRISKKQGKEPPTSAGY